MAGLTIPLPAAPADPAAALRWLVDRVAISDLLVEYARCADARDMTGFAALYTPDGVLEIAGTRMEGRQAIQDGVGALLADYEETHHVTTNHAAQVDGDRATATAYCIATHVFASARPHQHADAGVVYRCALTRTAEGWRFSQVVGERIWFSGGEVPGGDVR
jgi:uncharacterized protein (TIGR02246 family)